MIPQACEDSVLTSCSANENAYIEFEALTYKLDYFFPQDNDDGCAVDGVGEYAGVGEWVASNGPCSSAQDQPCQPNSAYGVGWVNGTCFRPGQ